jgi:hypothetical protein
VLIHRNDQGACFYLSALAVCYDRAAGTLVPRREAASFNRLEFFIESMPIVERAA